MSSTSDWNEKHLGDRGSMIKKGLCFWVKSYIKWQDNTGQAQSLLLCVVKEVDSNMYYCLPVFDYRTKSSKLAYTLGVWVHRSDILSMSFAKHIGVSQKTVTMANKILSHMVKETDNEDIIKEYNTRYLSKKAEQSIAKAIVEVENCYQFD